MISFAAATGLRPSEWIALEHRDLDRDARAVYVRRAFAHGRLQRTKTRRSTRAVPLQAIALEALDRLPAKRETPLFFPAAGAAAISTCTTSGAAPGNPPNARWDRAAAATVRPAPHVCGLAPHMRRRRPVAGAGSLTPASRGRAWSLSRSRRGCGGCCGGRSASIRGSAGLKNIYLEI
jgi:integrase